MWKRTKYFLSSCTRQYSHPNHWKNVLVQPDFNEQNLNEKPEMHLQDTVIENNQDWKYLYKFLIFIHSQEKKYIIKA